MPYSEVGHPSNWLIVGITIAVIASLAIGKRPRDRLPAAPKLCRGCGVSSPTFAKFCRHCGRSL